MKSLQRLLPIPFLLFLFLASVSPLHADDGAVLFTGDVQLKIADAFMEEGEYYRAVTEYKKFLILFPDSAKADYASFEIAMAYFKGEEYGAAARSFLALREKYPESGYAIQAGYLEGVQPMETEELRQGAGGAGDPRRAAPRVGICPPLARGDLPGGSR